MAIIDKNHMEAIKASLIEAEKAYPDNLALKVARDCLFYELCEAVDVLSKKVQASCQCSSTIVDAHGKQTLCTFCQTIVEVFGDGN